MHSEQELTNLGNETKNHSKIKWGSAQLVAGTYLAMGEDDSYGCRALTTDTAEATCPHGKV